MTSPKILIVEDDLEIREFLSLYLSNHGYRTVQAADGKQALIMFKREQPDMILLDILIPEISGLDICKTIRETSRVPIIFLTCKWEADDIVSGLELGADDYVTKPFEPKVLLARIKKNLHQFEKPKDILTVGLLQIDLNSYEARVNGKRVPLYAKEMQLLLFLAQRPNRVFSAEQLYDILWGPWHEGDLKTVMVHISNIRRKIEVDSANPKWIKTVRGFGYKFHVE